MKAKIISCQIEGVVIIESSSFIDDRGVFIKTFHSDFYIENGLNTEFKEEFFTVSSKNVIRGMHFQVPPFDQEKLVYCVKGKMLDVILDLRVNSLSYKQHISFELNGSDGKLIYIPKGLAHGFCSLEDNSIMIYNVTSMHSPDHDTGIRWDSFGFKWPVETPIISSRDRSFPTLESFKYPFK